MAHSIATAQRIIHCVVAGALIASVGAMARRAAHAQTTQTDHTVFLPVVAQGEGGSIDDDRCHAHDGILFCHASADHFDVDTSALSPEQQDALTARAINNPDVWRSKRVGDVGASALEGNEHVIGKWAGPFNWRDAAGQNVNLVGVFLSLLPNGKVLVWDAAQNFTAPPQDNTRAMVYDPGSDRVARRDLTPTNAGAGNGANLFCSGYAKLADGNLFVAGGNKNQATDGILRTYVFNYGAESWTRSADMLVERWYPSLIALNNSEMLIVGGSESNGAPEVRAANGAIRALPNLNLPYFRTRQYPFMQTAPNGRVAYFGPQPQLMQIDTGGSGAVFNGAARDSILRDYGSYGLFDAVAGRVLVSGGNYGANSTSATVVTMNSSAAVATGSMAIGRRQHQLTVLPDGSVLATGGIRDSVREKDLVDLSRSVYHAEVWNPSTGGWTQLAPQAIARQYHSAALLLPDGRVLSAGGGKCGACQLAGYENYNYEFFSPPYLFKKDGSGQLAPRPIIQSAPGVVQVNTQFVIRSQQAARISKAALIRLGSPTHGVDFEQRYVPLSIIGAAGDDLTVNAPANLSIAQAGYYMLFIVDSDGAPSVASIVRVSETPGTGAGPTATPLPGPTATVVPTQQPGGATQAIESESMTISAPMRVDRDPSASGSQFVQTTGVSPASCTTTTSGGWAESTFSVPTTGAYRIWARTLAQTSASDSFCVQLDGGALVTWAPAIDPAWRWSTVTGLPATLDAGSHTLRFRYRETATKLDKLIVTADLAYVPTGFGVGGPLATATPAPTATPTPGAPSATPDAPTATPTGVPQTATPLPSTPTLIVSSPTRSQQLLRRRLATARSSSRQNLASLAHRW
jgi:hypothetical protein